MHVVVQTRLIASVRFDLWGARLIDRDAINRVPTTRIAKIEIMNLRLNFQDVFNNFQGHWAFDRVVLNTHENTEEKASGEAVFTAAGIPDQDRLKYIENGFLQLSSHQKKIKFSRRYLYQRIENAIEVYFDDGIDKGLLFQKLTLDSNSALFKGSEHLCRLDKYNSTYLFLSENEFQTTYTVVGPKKNYTIVTDYRRAKGFGGREGPLSEV